MGLFLRWTPPKNVAFLLVFVFETQNGHPQTKQHTHTLAHGSVSELGKAEALTICSGNLGAIW